MPIYRFSLGLGINVASSEMYSPNKTTEPTYEEQLFLYARKIANGDGQIIISHTRYKPVQPLYKFSSSNKQYASSTWPVYILVGALDPQTISGYGLTVQQG